MVQLSVPCVYGNLDGITIASFPLICTTFNLKVVTSFLASNMISLYEHMVFAKKVVSLLWNIAIGYLRNVLSEPWVIMIHLFTIVITYLMNLEIWS